jgi:two-component system, OmpR family, phosphate regulon response regulator PhoB
MATILIVEDEEPIQGLLNITLTPEHQVVQATDPDQAIELARLTRPDLVLLDLNLRGHRDGLNVCRALRSNPDLALAQVPIVVLTGETAKAEIEAGLSAGANDYMGKPYRPSALLTLVDTLLAGVKI